MAYSAQRSPGNPTPRFHTGGGQGTPGPPGGLSFGPVARYVQLNPKRAKR